MVDGISLVFEFRCPFHAALRLGQVRGVSWVAINGITGTLGVGATLLALAMGDAHSRPWSQS
jgi:hypothetical protein